MVGLVIGITVFIVALLVIGSATIFNDETLK
jgi:hypothetical protein